MPRKSQPLPIDARALFVRNTREFLLFRRASDAPWEFPGGPANPNESPEGALRRWCKDLLNSEIGFITGQPPFVYGQGADAVAFRYYECTLNNPAAQPGAQVETRWIAAPQLRDYIFTPATQQVVEWLLGDGKPA